MRPKNLSPQALRDIDRAVDDIAESAGPVFADRFAVAVADAAERGARRPLLGHRRRLEPLPDPYRFHAVKGFSYLLVDNAARAGAPVARVAYRGRDLDALLAEWRDSPEPPEDERGR